MIPKIIHYCWFGHNPLPDIAVQCIGSWKKYCPDYEIKLWDENNFDLNVCPYVSEAYNAHKWAFVSDYARLKIIYENGGIYLDTDVELIKSLDFLLSAPCYLGTELPGYVNTGLGFGAEKGNKAVKLMLDAYEDMHYSDKSGMPDGTTCPVRNTNSIKKLGYEYKNETSRGEIWRHEYVTVYPLEYFGPMNYETRELNVTDNTVSIHRYSASWISKEDKELQEKLEKIVQQNGKITGMVKKHWVIYQDLKKKTELKSFLQYVLVKAKFKAGIKN